MQVMYHFDKMCKVFQACRAFRMLSNVANIVEILRFFQNGQEKCKMLQSLRIGQCFENSAVIQYVADITKTLGLLRMLLKFSPKKLLQCRDSTIVANVTELKKGVSKCCKGFKEGRECCRTYK